MTEQQLQNLILQYLRSRKIFCWRNNTVGVYDAVKKCYRKPSRYHVNGIPDIIGIYNQKVFFVEVKKPASKPRTREQVMKLLSEAQIAFLNRCKVEGIPYLCTDGLKAVEAFIASF